MNTTPYYDLPLYEDNDPTNLRDGYNNAMLIIDQRLHIIETQLNLAKTNN